MFLSQRTQTFPPPPPDPLLARKFPSLVSGLHFMLNFTVDCTFCISHILLKLCSIFRITCKTTSFPTVITIFWSKTLLNANLTHLFNHIIHFSYTCKPLPFVWGRDFYPQQSTIWLSHLFKKVVTLRKCWLVLHILF